MRLDEFISSHKEEILQEWEDFARTILPATEGMDRKALRNFSGRLLDFVVHDMQRPQSAQQQVDKSRGQGPLAQGAERSLAKEHSDTRFEAGFSIMQMASEFRALRASVMKLWNKARNKAEDDGDQVNRFHESIDQLMMEALARHSENLNRARALFLGTLIHDMRNPLSAVSNSIQLIPLSGVLNERQEKLVALADRSTKTVVNLVTDLIDATRSRLGKGLPISPTHMDLGDAVREAAKEAEASRRHGSVVVKTEGNLEGEWDSLRMNRVLSNLIGNALQHGKENFPVEVSARGEAENVTLSVHNHGEAIPPQDLPNIFDPLKRGHGENQKKTEKTSLGLGLYITKEIIDLHGGKVDVTSTKDDGTTFIAWLPRHCSQAEASGRSSPD